MLRLEPALPVEDLQSTCLVIPNFATYEAPQRLDSQPTTRSYQLTRMKSVALIAAAIAASVAPLVAADGAAGHAWGYTTANESIAAPEHWVEYYPTCGGTRQSPIDISTKSCGDSGASPLSFDGECSSYTLSQSEEAYKGAVVGGTLPIVCLMIVFGWLLTNVA